MGRGAGRREPEKQVSGSAMTRAPTLEDEPPGGWTGCLPGIPSAHGTAPMVAARRGRCPQRAATLAGTKAMDSGVSDTLSVHGLATLLPRKKVPRIDAGGSSTRKTEGD